MNDPNRTLNLVGEAKAGNRAAFDSLIDSIRERIRSRVESWAQFRIGPRLDIDDVLQETFLRAFRGLERFEWHGEDAFFGWLCGIAKHALADSARAARRDVLHRARGVSLSREAADEPSPGQRLRREERFVRFGSALDKLPPHYRQVLSLARLEGLTLKEIAGRMNRSPNAVKHLIARALRELKKEFGDTESLHLPDRRLDVQGERDGE